MKRLAIGGMLLALAALACDQRAPAPPHPWRVAQKPGSPIALSVVETRCDGADHVFELRIQPGVAVRDFQIATDFSGAAQPTLRPRAEATALARSERRVERLAFRSPPGAYARVGIVLSGRSEEGLPVAAAAEIEIHPENAPPDPAGRRTVDSQGRAVVEFEGETRSP